MTRAEKIEKALKKIAAIPCYCRVPVHGEQCHPVIAEEALALPADQAPASEKAKDEVVMRAVIWHGIMDYQAMFEEGSATWDELAEDAKMALAKLGLALALLSSPPAPVEKAKPKCSLCMDDGWFRDNGVPIACPYGCEKSKDPK